MAMTGPREREKDRLVLLVLGRDDFLLWRTSIRPLFCQTMTLPHGETANPSGSAIPALRRGRGVLAFGDLMSDARGRLWQDRRLGRSENQWSSTRHSRRGRDWWVPR